MYMKLCGRPTTIYTCSYSVHEARDDDDDDIELHNEALGIVLRDEALSNGDEEAVTIAEEIGVEGLKECGPSEGTPSKTCSL